MELPYTISNLRHRIETKTEVIYEGNAYLEQQGIEKCWEAYNTNTPNEHFFEVGFNSHSGYVYIALESNITICSAFGQDVEYLVTDFDNGEEFFFDTYEDASEKLEELEKLYS